MHIRLLTVVLLLGVVFAGLIFFFRSNRVLANDGWWGCSFNTVDLMASIPYVISYEWQAPLTNFSVGTSHETPVYWGRPAGSTSWLGPNRWDGPKIRFYSGDTIQGGINADQPLDQNQIWERGGNYEYGYEWVPNSNISLTKVEFYSSAPGAFKIRIWDETDGAASMPNQILAECGGNSSSPQLVANAGGPYNGFEGSPIVFDGTGSTDVGGTITSYQWDFSGNGQYTDATGPNPSHTWPDDYTGTAVLKVTDSNSQSATAAAVLKVANVAPSVIADNSINPIVTAGQPIILTGSFKDPGQDTFTIKWDFGDGFNAEGNLTTTHTYIQAGSYTATLIVTDDDSGVGSDKILVTVVPPINAIRATINFSPETLSLTSRGNWVTVKIQLPAGYDARNIDPASLAIKGPITIEASPIGAASLGGVTSTGLVVKFDRQKVQGTVQPGDIVQVNVSGKLTDGTIFAGSDTIRVIN